MSSFSFFIHLAKANCKRLGTYLLPILTAVLILFAICSFAAGSISSRLYKKGIASLVSIAYYLPEDSDQQYTEMALGMVDNIESVKNTISLIQVDNVDEGYRLLEDGKVLFFILVPEQFFSGIMDSTNPRLTIAVRDNNSISAYIANELLLAYSRYLGIAQAGVYSTLDTARENGLERDAVNAASTRVNLAFLDRALSKDKYLEKEICTNEGSVSLLQHYLASALILSLFFTAFVFMPLLKDYPIGMQKLFAARQFHGVFLWLENFISSVFALYFAFIPCFICISIFYKDMNITGLFTAFPAILLIAALVSFIATISPNTFMANMLILFTAIVLLYIGGGILPSAMLPSAVSHLADVTPGRYLLSVMERALY